MLALTLVVVLAATILFCTLVARRLQLAPPVLLLACGALLGFIPGLASVRLPPEAVLLLFLPALLYWESITTSLREIRSNLRGIVLTSTLLVFLTAGSVAVIAHLFGVAWGPAWVLGAAVAPTDATAVGVLTRSLPRRNVTILRAESLINDGTALVLYSIAVSAMVGDMTMNAWTISGALALSYIGGAIAGLLVAWIAIVLRRRLHEAMTQNIAILLTPFAAYLLAEVIHASGVLAVVIVGLIISQAAPKLGKAAARQQTESFWSLATFLLNGSLFVLVGIQLISIVRDLGKPDIGLGLLLVAAVSAGVIAVRFAFLFAVTYVLRLFDRRPPEQQQRFGSRARVVSGMAGFRGAVSLAAALAVPQLTSAGDPFPARDLIIFVTAGVIVVTILGQGLALPAIVHWAHLPADTSIDEERHLAETRATEEALAALPQLAKELETSADVVQRLKSEYEEVVNELHSHRTPAEMETGSPPSTAAHDRRQQQTELRLALLARKRDTVIRLRDENRIDDIVLRQLQDSLDIEEVRLTGREPVD